MDNPIDHPLDLGLVNYTKHPSDNNYVVFRFADQLRADAFDAELKAKNIWFERDSQDSKSRTYHLFGIHKRDFKVAQTINFSVEGKHKRPLIPMKSLRYSVVIFGMFMLLLAVIGYCKQQEELASYDKTNRSINKQSQSE